MEAGFASFSATLDTRGGSAPRGAVRIAAPGRAMTRHARRLRGVLRPVTQGARLSALYRGIFRGISTPRLRTAYKEALNEAPPPLRPMPFFGTSLIRVVVPVGDSEAAPSSVYETARRARRPCSTIWNAFRRAPSASRMR